MCAQDGGQHDKAAIRCRQVAHHCENEDDIVEDEAVDSIKGFDERDAQTCFHELAVVRTGNAEGKKGPRQAITVCDYVYVDRCTSRMYMFVYNMMEYMHHVCELQ